MADVEMAASIPLPPDSPAEVSTSTKVGSPSWLLPVDWRSSPVPASKPANWVPQELLGDFPIFSKLWDWHIAEHVHKKPSSEAVHSCPACLGGATLLQQPSADWRSVDNRRRHLIKERDDAQALAAAVQADVEILSTGLTKANERFEGAVAVRRKLVASLTLLRESLPADVRHKYLPAEGGGTDDIAPIERPSDDIWSWMPAWRNFAIYCWAMGLPLVGVEVYSAKDKHGRTTTWVTAAHLRGYLFAQKIVDPSDITSMTALAMTILSHGGNGYQVGRVTLGVPIAPGDDMSLVHRVIFADVDNYEPVIRALASMGIEDDLVWDMSLFLREWVTHTYRNENANSLAAPDRLDEIWPDVLANVTKDSKRPDGMGDRIGAPGWQPRRVQLHRDKQLVAQLQAEEDAQASEELSQLDEPPVTDDEVQGIANAGHPAPQGTSDPTMLSTLKSSTLR